MRPSFPISSCSTNPYSSSVRLLIQEGVGRKLAESVQFTVTFCGAMGYSF